MSVTTTQNVATYTVAQTLSEYQVHRTQADDHIEGLELDQGLAGQEIPSVSHTPVPQWETQYRRVPPYRPVNTQLDFDSRNITLNGVERFFIRNMFGGISMVESLNKIWRATGGKINDSYFRFQIGGEY